jgi:hypothetical protein
VVVTSSANALALTNKVTTGKALIKIDLNFILVPFRCL